MEPEIRFKEGLGRRCRFAVIEHKSNSSRVLLDEDLLYVELAKSMFPKPCI